MPGHRCSGRLWRGLARARTGVLLGGGLGHRWCGHERLRRPPARDCRPVRMLSGVRRRLGRRRGWRRWEEVEWRSRGGVRYGHAVCAGRRSGWVGTERRGHHGARDHRHPHVLLLPLSPQRLPERAPETHGGCQGARGRGRCGGGRRLTRHYRQRRATGTRSAAAGGVGGHPGRWAALRGSERWQPCG